MTCGRVLLVVLVLSGGCAALGDAVRAIAPAPEGAPHDPTDTGLGLVELLAGAAAALGIGGPVAGITLAAVRRGRALRAVVRGVEAAGHAGTKRAVAKAADEAGSLDVIDAHIEAATGRRVAARRKPT